MTTRFVAEDIMPSSLTTLVRDHSFSSYNLPDGYYTEEDFKEFVERISHSRIPQSLARTIEGFVPLELGNSVSLFGMDFTVISKSFNVEEHRLTYHVR